MVGCASGGEFQMRGIHGRTGNITSCGGEAEGFKLGPTSLARTTSPSLIPLICSNAVRTRALELLDGACKQAQVPDASPTRN